MTQHHGASARQFYEYEPDSNRYAGVGFAVGEVDNDDYAKINSLSQIDTPLRQSWKSLACFCYDENPSEEGDFPTVLNCRRLPMISFAAWNALEPIIGDACEILPVNHPFSGGFHLLHVMRTIDALDEDTSQVERLSGDLRIYRIHKYRFKFELIEGEHIFKLPVKSGSGLIVDDVFRKTVECNGLRGLCFHELAML